MHDKLQFINTITGITCGRVDFDESDGLVSFLLLTAPVATVGRLERAHLLACITHAVA